MVESEAHELSEAKCLKQSCLAIRISNPLYKLLLSLQKNAQKTHGNFRLKIRKRTSFIERLKKLAINDLKKAYAIKEKSLRNEKVG